MSIDLPPILDRYLAWWIAGAIVLLGLFVYGLRDVLRFSITRVWAISSVGFAESIRRRVLWITPLAILGVIIVSQRSNPIDEQDAIRQTTKFALFASGMVVVITAIILACTNLPREIESRVIFTIVTKPTTRLEIILGKIIGFARVSAAILLIMGVFSFGYLEFRAWSLRNYIVKRLEAGDYDVISKPTLEYYKQAGLLSAREYERPDELQVYSRMPIAGDERRWFTGGAEGSFLVPFSIPRASLVRGDEPQDVAGLGVAMSIGFQKGESAPASAEEPDAPPPTTLPYLIQNPDATLDQVRLRNGPKTAESIARAEREKHAADRPSVSIEILDRNLNTLVDPKLINGGKPFPLNDAYGEQQIIFALPPDAVRLLARSSEFFFIEVASATGGFEYSAGPQPVTLISEKGAPIDAMSDPRGGRNGKPLLPVFRTRQGTYGMQLRGGTSGVVPVAHYKFRDAKAQPASDGSIPFELRVGIESSDSNPGEEQPTTLELTFVDRARNKKPDAATGPANSERPAGEKTADGASAGARPTTSPVVGTTIHISPETNRTTYFTVPGSAIPSPDFDIYIRAITPGHYVGVQARSISMVTADQSFAFNLFKSLFVLWLLSVLVIIISVFSSTIVSWPIAIVLTLLVLLGHWGVDQLGDAIAPGIGNAVVSDFFRTKDVNVAVTVSNTVEALTKLLRFVSSILPDISRFSAIEDLERGVAVSMSRLTESATVIALFGVPLIVLSYVRLRNKEVAP